MCDRAIDALTINTAHFLSRRASLLGLGAAALAAVTRPAPAQARKAGKKAKKACKRQVGKCESSIRTFCEGAEECETEFLSCCQSFKGCKAADEVFACLVDAFIGV